MEKTQSPDIERFEQLLLQLYPDAERTQDGQLAVAGPRGVLLRVTEERLEVSLPHDRKLNDIKGTHVLQRRGFWGARTLRGFRDTEDVIAFINPAFPGYDEITWGWHRCYDCGRPLPMENKFGYGDAEFCRTCFQVSSRLENRPEL